ncbi:MAG: hypothetical protein L0Y64_04520 [Myxococcaceae bacterium]|nr:hypothetical protein [Myxococcaceae bacterium]
MLEKLVGGLMSSFMAGNPLEALGSGGPIGTASGIGSLSAPLKGGLGASTTVEASSDKAASHTAAVHTELMEEPCGCDGYSGKADGTGKDERARQGAPQPQGGGFLGFLAKLADPLGLFGGMNMADPLGLLGGLFGGGGLTGTLGADDGKKAEGLLGDQAQMGGLLSMLGSSGGGGFSLLGLFK